MNSLTIKKEHLPARCEVCHQTDRYFKINLLFFSLILIITSIYLLPGPAELLKIFPDLIYPPKPSPTSGEDFNIYDIMVCCGWHISFSQILNIFGFMALASILGIIIGSLKYFYQNNADSKITMQ